MLLIVCKVYLAVGVAGLLLAITACGTVATPEDIPPMTIEAQAEPATPAELPATDLPVEIQAEATPTGLPTEIVMPNSPVVQPAAAPANPGAFSVPGSEAALAAALANLAQQTGIPADQITVQSIEATEWPDASLGCPQEGMMYAQVVTPGFLMVLTAQGQTYEYHTDQQATVVLCKK